MVGPDVRHLGHVQQALHARAQADESAEIGDPRHDRFHELARPVVFLHMAPRVRLYFA